MLWDLFTFLGYNLLIFFDNFLINGNNLTFWDNKKLVVHKYKILFALVNSKKIVENIYIKSKNITARFQSQVW